MIKICCDLCERDMSYDENKTRVTLEDDNGYDCEFGLVFRRPRKIKIDICDDCLNLLKKKEKKKFSQSKCDQRYYASCIADTNCIDDCDMKCRYRSEND